MGVIILFMFLASTTLLNSPELKSCSSRNRYNADLNNFNHFAVGTAWHKAGNLWEVLVSWSMAALPALLGTGALVHFYLLSHRESDVHSENAFFPC